MPRVKHPITNEIMSVRGAESFWAVNPETGKKSKYLINDYRLDGKGTPIVHKPDKPDPEPKEPEEIVAPKEPVKPVEKKAPEGPPAIEMPAEAPKEPVKKVKTKQREHIDTTKSKKSWFEGEWFY